MFDCKCRKDFLNMQPVLIKIIKQMQMKAEVKYDDNVKYYFLSEAG